MAEAGAIDVDTMAEEKQRPSLIQRVETIGSVIERLLEALAGLNDKELENFREVLWGQTDFHRHWSDIQWRLLMTADMQDTVFLMVQNDSQQSVKTAMEVLEMMKRTDLVQRLSDSSSGSKKKHSDEHRSALIQKVATMAAVKQLLLETLNDLSGEELEKFKKFLERIISEKNLTEMSSPFRLTEDRAEIVDVMLQTYSQQSVQLTREAVKEMNRTDLMQRLSDSSSELEEKHPEGEHQPEALEAVLKSAVKRILLETLKDLSSKVLEKFKLFVQFTYFQKGLPHISWSQLEQAGSAEALVDLMVENQQSVEMTKEVFMDMNRTDLVEKLSAISARIRGYDPTIKVSLPKAALLKFGFSVKVNCAVLIYKTNKPFLNFHVYLIPQDPLLQEEVDRRELSNGSTRILKPHPQKPLKMRDHFILTADVDGAKIFPDKVKLGRSPDFFEVFIENPDKVFKLQLERENDHQPVWTCQIRKVDYQRSTGPLQGSERTRPLVIIRRTKRRSLDISAPEKHQSEPLHKEVTVTPIMEKLLETLKKLRYHEFEHFKWLLEHTARMKGLPRIPRQSMETADRVEIAALMEEIYGKQSVEVAREVLMEMGRIDLVECLPEISSGSKGPSRSLELEGCGTITQDSSDWTKVEPEVNRTDADEASTYSLQSEAGNFECSVSGLRWACKEKVSFKYQFCSLSGHMERIESGRYMPAGPLMDITVIDGKFDVVYLPHWICIDDNPTILDKFAVLHIDDCGHVLIKVSEVTSSHVKLSDPQFSLVMVLLESVGPPVEIYCKVLIYSRIFTGSSQTTLTLHVYLIPSDPGLEERLDSREKECKGILNPKLEKPLKMGDKFILTTDQEGAEIYPEGEEPQTIMLRHDSTDPNFYKVIVENPDKNLKLTLTPTNGDQPIWTCKILEGEWQSTGHKQEKHSVVKHQEAADRKKLLKMLKGLGDTEFKEFKCLLPGIANSKLENSDRVDIVNLMLQTYTHKCAEVAKEILEEIERNDLVKLFSDTSLGSEAAGSSA